MCCCKNWRSYSRERTSRSLLIHKRATHTRLEFLLCSAIASNDFPESNLQASTQVRAHNEKSSVRQVAHSDSKVQMEGHLHDACAAAQHDLYDAGVTGATLSHVMSIMLIVTNILLSLRNSTQADRSEEGTSQLRIRTATDRKRQIFRTNSMPNVAKLWRARYRLYRSRI